MFKSLSIRSTHIANLRQASILLAIGVLCLLGALLLHSVPPLGVFLCGLGMLISAAFNPYRLLIAGVLLSIVGFDVYLTFAHTIPYAGSALILAIGIALLPIAFAARRGYVGVGAITPAILVILIGLIEFPPATRLLPGNYVSFLLSLWFPAIGLICEIQSLSTSKLLTNVNKGGLTCGKRIVQ